MGATIELALVRQQQKHSQIIGAQETHKLGFAGKGKEIHCQEQGDHLAISKARLNAAFAAQERCSCC